MVGTHHERYNPHLIHPLPVPSRGKAGRHMSYVWSYPMNSEDTHPNGPASPMPRPASKATSPLEPVLADACRRALKPDMPFKLLLEFCRSIVGLARELRNERAGAGLSQHLPLTLVSQIEAVRDLVAQHALDPTQPEAMADRLRKLVAGLTKTADLARPPRPTAIVLTHPAFKSKWLH